MPVIFELSRGLLWKKEYRRGGPVQFLVRKEEREYAQNLQEYVQSIQNATHCGGYLGRFSHIQLYTYYPGLSEQRITTYPDDGGTPHVETTEYTYDTHRRLTEMTRMVNGTTSRETYTYTGDYSSAPYAEMQTRNMTALPVEQLCFRKDTVYERLVSAELTTWKKMGGKFIPAGQWKADLGDGISPFSFNAYGGTAKDSRYGTVPERDFKAYDSNGNLVLSEDRGGTPATYVWTPDGCHPAAIFTGARRSYVQRDSSDVSHNQVESLEPGDRLAREFDCIDPFTMNLILICPQGQNWYLNVLIDGASYPMTKINSTYTQSVWSDSGYGQYPAFRQVSIPAGAHRLSVNVGLTYYAGQGSSPVGCTLLYNYVDKDYTDTTVPGQTVLFEDFEEDGNVTTNGYFSGKSHQGTWTHSLSTSCGPYRVDYRVYRNGKWNPVRNTATGSTVTISEGTAPIDHIRVYPEGSLPESYTWDAAGNLLSKTDARGATESYEYDAQGRLVAIYDNEGKKVGGYGYNYQNR